jgi:hypothetical protein
LKKALAGQTGVEAVEGTDGADGVTTVTVVGVEGTDGTKIFFICSELKVDEDDDEDDDDEDDDAELECDPCCPITVVADGAVMTVEVVVDVVETDP